MTFGKLFHRGVCAGTMGRARRQTGSRSNGTALSSRCCSSTQQQLLRLLPCHLRWHRRNCAAAAPSGTQRRLIRDLHYLWYWLLPFPPKQKAGRKARIRLNRWSTTPRSPGERTRPAAASAAAVSGSLNRRLQIPPPRVGADWGRGYKGLGRRGPIGERRAYLLPSIKVYILRIS